MEEKPWSVHFDMEASGKPVQNQKKNVIKVIGYNFNGFGINVTTRIVAGAIIVIMAKVLMWYGVGAHKTYNV
jgi:hypothetical protein